MNILVKIELNDSTFKYYAKNTIEYAGNTYIGVLNKVSGIPYKLMTNNSFSATTINLYFNDISGEIRDLINSNLWVNAKATIMTEAGITDILRIITLSKSGIGEGTAIISGIDNIQSLDSIVDLQITKDYFPDAIEDSIGQAIPYHVGTIDAISTGTIKAWRVDKDKSTGRQYLLNEQTAIASSILKVYTPGGTDVTSSCTQTTGADGKFVYVKYTGADVDYLMVNMTYGFSFVTNDIKTIVLGRLPAPYNVDVDSTLFDDGERNYDGSSAVFYQGFNTGAKILKEFCDNYDLLGYYIDNNSNVRFVKGWYDFSDAFTFQDGEVLNFATGEGLSSKIENLLTGKYLWDGVNNTRSLNADFSNLKNYGIYKKEHKFNLLRDKRGDAYNTLKSVGVKRQFPLNTCNFQIGYELIEKYNIIPGKYFYLTDENALTDTERFYYINSYVPNADEDTVNVKAVDVTHLLDIDLNTILLINGGEVNNSEEIFNSAANGFLQLVNNGIYDSTAQVKLNTTSERCDGSSYLVSDSDINPEVLEKFDITNTSITNNFTISKWLRYDATGTSRLTIGKYEDANNQWSVQKRSSEVIRFVVTSAGTNVILVESTTVMTPGTWYHVAVIKVGSDIGVYINGVLEGYVSNSNSYSVDSDIYIAGGTGSFFTGNFDSLVVNLGNPFNASPDAGLTDTITVPVNPISWYNPAGT